MRSPHRPRRPSLDRTLVAVGLALTLLPLGSATMVQPVHPNELFYASWSMDLNKNRIDDALDADIAAGEGGQVYLFVHYAKKPTAADAALLEESYGASRTFVYHRWDTIQVDGLYTKVGTIAKIPGVAAVEKFTPPTLDLDVSAKAVRAREAAGVPVVGGIDHALSPCEDLNICGQGMVVAILDTGVNNLHESLDDLDDNPNTDDPKLVQRLDPLQGLLHASADAQNGFAVVGCVDPVDDQGHGSHVAGTAVGTGGPSGQFRGVAPQARLVDVDISPGGVGLGIGIGFQFLIDFNAGLTCYGNPGADRIDVASISFSFPPDDPQSFLNVAFTDVVRSGITFTVSAGNGAGAGNANTLTKGPEGAIMVANANDRNTVVRSDDSLSCSSSRGKRTADGDADTIDELRPDVAAPGTNILAPNYLSTNGYVSKSGTSMAAPHAAGIAALVLQANPNLRPVDLGSNNAMGNAGAVPVRDVLQKSAQPKTDVAGCLALQHQEAGRFGLPWNNGWGYGLADAWKAVAVAQAS